MEKNSKSSFVVDTSAFISLESVNLLEKVCELFNIITISSVIKELETFSEHADKYGLVAERILGCKDKFELGQAAMRARKSRLMMN